LHSRTTSKSATNTRQTRANVRQPDELLAHTDRRLSDRFCPEVADLMHAILVRRSSCLCCKGTRVLHCTVAS
jgi:hypothetical protein